MPYRQVPRSSGRQRADLLVAEMRKQPSRKEDLSLFPFGPQQQTANTAIGLCARSAARCLVRYATAALLIPSAMPNPGNTATPPTLAAGAVDLEDRGIALPRGGAVSREGGAARDHVQRGERGLRLAQLLPVTPMDEDMQRWIWRSAGNAPFAHLTPRRIRLWTSYSVS